MDDLLGVLGELVATLLAALGDLAMWLLESLGESLLQPLLDAVGSWGSRHSNETTRDLSTQAATLTVLNLRGGASDARPGRTRPDAGR